LCWHEALKGVFLRVKTWRYANESCNFTATPANLFKLEKYDCENISLNLILVIHLFMFLIEQLTFWKIVESGINNITHNPSFQTKLPPLFLVESKHPSRGQSQHHLHQHNLLFVNLQAMGHITPILTYRYGHYWR
jgi:hypothetical protein